MRVIVNYVTPCYSRIVFQYLFLPPHHEKHIIVTFLYLRLKLFFVANNLVLFVLSLMMCVYCLKVHMYLYLYSINSVYHFCSSVYIVSVDPIRFFVIDSYLSLLLISNHIYSNITQFSSQFD